MLFVVICEPNLCCGPCGCGCRTYLSSWTFGYVICNALLFVIAHLHLSIHLFLGFFTNGGQFSKHICSSLCRFLLWKQEMGALWAQEQENSRYVYMFMATEFVLPYLLKPDKGVTLQHALGA